MFDIGKNHNIVIKDTSILLIEEFKVIWDKDKTKTKASALKEFAYLYFKNDFKSPYRGGYTVEELPKILKKDLTLPKNWKPSKQLILAEEKYNALQTTKSLKVLMAAEKALDQIQTYFETFSLDSLSADKKADAISKLMNNLKNVDEVVSKLETAKKRVAEDLTSKNLSGKKVLTSRELPKNKR